MQKDIIHKFVNFDNRDFHIHTSSFSDGLNTIEEMVKFAWEIGLSEICITDHSDAAILWYFQDRWIFPSAWRWSIPSYENVFNSVKVSFWVEWDIVNENWDTCFTIQGKDSEFRILSAHSDIYEDNPDTVTEATIRAIEKNADKIAFIAHPTCSNQFWKYYDLKRLIEVANHFHIPLELNWKSVARGKSDEEKVRYLLENVESLYFNSDAHNLADLKNYRPKVAKMLLDWGYIWKIDYDKFMSYFSM